LDLQSVETATQMPVKALVDCGATGNFIDSEYVISRNLPVQRLLQPILVLNVDGSLNQAGGITGIVNLSVLSTLRSGTETTGTIWPATSTCRSCVRTRRMMMMKRMTSKRVSHSVHR
jgi:hypothetical protein